MNKLDLLPGRALGLAGDALRTLSPKASTLLGTGVKLGALKTGARVGMAVVRRNPVIAVASVAGAGLLWYAAKRRAERARTGDDGAIEGSSRRIEANKADKSDSATKTRTTRRASTGTRRASTGSRSRSSSESRTEH